MEVPINMACHLRPSPHAKDRMIERGLSKEEIIEAILKGAKRAQHPNKIISIFKRIKVVYKQYPCNYLIITVYWRE